MKITLKYIGEHLPKGMLKEVEENEVEQHLKMGFVKEDSNIQEPKHPIYKMKEVEIVEWITQNNIKDINYDPNKHSKDWVINKLKEKGYI